MAKKKATKSKLDHSERMEIASDIAAVFTERWGDKTHERVYQHIGRETSFTDAAQDVFGKWYDNAEGVMASVLGEETDDDVAGTTNAPKYLTQDGYRRLVHAFVRDLDDDGGSPDVLAVRIKRIVAEHTRL